MDNTCLVIRSYIDPYHLAVRGRSAYAPLGAINSQSPLTPVSSFKLSLWVIIELSERQAAGIKKIEDRLIDHL
jgi:hypothetical protein